MLGWYEVALVNYVVDDLRAMLDALRKEGVWVDPKVGEYDYGKFGWIMDPDGNRIALWEPLPKKENHYPAQKFSWLKILCCETYGAVERTRTSTVLLPPAPQAGASASSATTALA